VHSEENAAAPNALAPVSGAGAGLQDHSSRDAVSPVAGTIAGLLALVFAVGVGAMLWTMNPSFGDGRAGGSANQMAAPVAAGAQLEPGTPAADGATIIAGQACIGCHVIPGIPGATGQVGPNLAGVASRPKIAGGAVDNAGQDDLKRWVLNPPALKPGTAMPNLGLTDDQATKIAAYLETLK